MLGLKLNHVIKLNQWRKYHLKNAYRHTDPKYNGSRVAANNSDAFWLKEYLISIQIASLETGAIYNQW